MHKQWPLIPVAPHRSTDSSSVECLAQAKNWWQHCSLKHTECAHSPDPSLEQPDLPTRLIAVGSETKEPYLYETKPNEKGMYAALSYCWGLSRTFTTTLSTLDARKQGFTLADLPNTCRDAVIAARSLGLSYIWIDSLCIIQDNKDDWEREAVRMCDVYSNSAVTLAGLSSPDSDTGLFMSNPARQTYYLPCVWGDGNAGYVYARKDFSGLAMGFLHTDTRRRGIGHEVGGVLQTRGWTLQELTLSPRILWFSEWELAWSCRTQTACECDPILTSQLMKRGAARISTNPKEGETPPLEQWRSFVKTFTRRKLTHATDRLPALMGIATAMSKRIEGRYLAGLWEEQLERNLLWTTDRTGMDCDQAALLEAPRTYVYAPSWSWASTTLPIWFISWTNSSRYQSVWRIQGIQFTYATSSPFGSGSGTITVDTVTIPLEVLDDSYFAYPWKGGYLSFSDMEDSWFPDYRLSGGNFMFLFAGIQGRLQGDPTGCITRFVGLVVEEITKDVYRRIGLINGTFKSGCCNGSWLDWQDASSKQQITLI